VIVATICATYALTKSLPKIYTSSAELFIDFRSNDPISGRQFTQANDESYMQTQVDMIRSEEVANRIIETTKLMSAETVRKIIERDGDVKARSIVIEGIGKSLEVNMRRTSRVVELKYSADSPTQARDALNAAIQAYMDLVMRISLAPAKSRQEQYNSQLESLRQELDRIQSSITKYQQEYGIVDADERLDTGSRQLNELTTRQSAAQSLRLEADARHRAIQALLKAGVPPMDIPEVAQQRGIPELRLRLSDLDRQTAEVTNIYGRNHPRYKIVTAEREMLMRRLERESEVALSAVLMEQRRFDTQTGAIAKEVEDQQRKLLEMKKHRDVISSYQRQMESVRQVYTSQFRNTTSC
jgi:succinoglycan biosynthesis transport protein ExoP